MHIGLYFFNLLEHSLGIIDKGLSRAVSTRDKKEEELFDQTKHGYISNTKMKLNHEKQ